MEFKKLPLLVLLFLLSTLNLFASTVVGGLSGLIFDDATNTPLNGVNVSIDNIKLVNDSLGNFTFPAIEIGQHTVVVEKMGYLTQRVSINIEANTVKTLRIYLKYNALKLSEVLIKSDRATSAATSSVLKEIDFQLRPVNSAQDMLRNVPGLFTAQHAGGGKAEQIFIRGFDCDHGTDFAGYLDGIPINMPSHGHGQGYLDMHFLIPETVKDIEVYKGPYFAELGDFATAGAVKFKTLDRLEKNTVQFEVGTAPTQRAFSHSRVMVNYQLPINNDKISSYIAVEDIFAPSYFDASQNFKRFSIMSKTKLELTDHSSLSLLLTHFNSSWDASGQIPQRSIDDGTLERFGSIDNSEGGHTSRQNASLTYNYFDKNQSFKLQAYASKYDFSLYSDFTFFLNDPINGDEINQQDHRYVSGVNSEYSINAGNSKFSIGGGYRYDDIHNQLDHVAKRQFLDEAGLGHVAESNTNIYVKEVYQLAPKFRAEVGLRFNYLNYDVQDLLPSDSMHQNYSNTNYQFQVAPKVNLTYSLNEKDRLFLNFGRGFHSNDARAVVQDFGNHRLPDLFGGEIGVLLHPFKNTIVSAALWGMELENELVFNSDDATTVNNGSSRRLGIDVGVRSTLTPWLFLDLDVNVTRGRLVDKVFGSVLTENYFIPLAPSLSSTGGLTFHFPSGIEGSVRYRHLNDRPAIEDNSVNAIGYTLMDLNLFYKTPKYRVGFNVENALNVKWNEAEFATESRLKNETTSTNELHFTPGTPFTLKAIFSYYF